MADRIDALSPEGQKKLRTELRAAYDKLCAQGLELDMTRGKPSTAQLDLADALLSLPGEGGARTPGGVDTRNYGGVDGIDEMKALFAAYLDVVPEQIVVGGNGSLELMHSSIVWGLLHGVPGGSGPWRDVPGGIKFLCPSPGYDRHFAICEHHGIEMVVVGIGDDGPDMDQVEELVAADASIKGIWCVPKYSNPTGITYSDAVVERLARMRCAAPDFRIIWDNAYSEHHLGGKPARLANLLSACKAAGNEDRALMIASTSKITFAGAGVCAMAASEANLAAARSHLAISTIGPDKVNQLRHVRFFGDIAGLRTHMNKHAELLRPKFDAVKEIFERELAGKGVATWTKPEGGYFVSVDAPDGCAAEVVRLASEAGVKLTAAGATFPYGKDPRDRNLRIAPSLPELPEIEQAMQVIASIQLAAVEQLLSS